MSEMPSMNQPSINQALSGNSRPVKSAGVTAATLAKDLRLEWRSKDAINSMLFFSLLVVVVFSFSFDPNAEESSQIAGRPGVGSVSFCRCGGA